MDEQVQHGQLSRDVRVAEAKAGQDLRDLGVPGELALLDEHRQRRAGERLAV